LEGNLSFSSLNNSAGLGQTGNSLGGEGFSLLSGFSLSLVVLSDSVQEIFSASGLLDMLDSDMDSLLQLSVTDDFVDDNTDGSGSDIENLSGLSMIEFVGHTTLMRGISDNIDEVTSSVAHQVFGEVGGTMLSEGLREQISSSVSVTK